MARRQKKNLKEIVLNIYRELYQKATPSADFDQLLEDAKVDDEGRKVIDYESYYLDSDVYDEIVKRHIKENKLTGFDKTAVQFEVYLGVGPSGAKPKPPKAQE